MKHPKEMKVWTLLALFLLNACIAINGQRSSTSKPTRDFFLGQSDCDSIIARGFPTGRYALDPVFLEKIEWVWSYFGVLCEKAAGVGWTVIQRHDVTFSDDLLNFTRTWDDYARGFGNLTKEFWMGNEWIYRLSKAYGPYELRIELEDWDGQTAWAQYSNFRMDSEENSYRLSVSGYTGNASDGLHSGSYAVPFSTYDRRDSGPNGLICKSPYGGEGWWYYRCCEVTNLNGGDTGIAWLDNADNHHTIKSTKMMIRAKYYRNIMT